MPVIVFKRFQNKLTGLIIRNTGRDITPGVFIADVDLFSLVRLLLAHDGLDDLRCEFALFGEVSHLDGLGMRWCGKSQSDFIYEILLFDIIQI